MSINNSEVVNESSTEEGIQKMENGGKKKLCDCLSGVCVITLLCAPKLRGIFTFAVQI